MNRCRWSNTENPKSDYMAQSGTCDGAQCNTVPPQCLCVKGSPQTPSGTSAGCCCCCNPRNSVSCCGTIKSSGQKFCLPNCFLPPLQRPEMRKEETGELTARLRLLLKRIKRNSALVSLLTIIIANQIHYQISTQFLQNGFGSIHSDNLRTPSYF